ncbi:MAG UNVERIFIED_CONTAM: hypothetical protein LVR29_34700 [Microcystis novacekii LVE1205-3]
MTRAFSKRFSQSRSGAGQAVFGNDSGTGGLDPVRVIHKRFAKCLVADKADDGGGVVGAGGVAGGAADFGLGETCGVELGLQFLELGASQVAGLGADGVERRVSRWRGC